MNTYQYHGRLVGFRSGQPLKEITVYASPESGDPSDQVKTDKAGNFTGAFSTPSTFRVLHRPLLINRIDIHYLTPRGWVILRHTLSAEDQDLTKTPAIINLGTLAVPG